jgi:glycosyltransferase involved in cell wall biosynthesis
MNANPLVSIVIPAFNAYPTIERALDSCDAQTLTEFEVIIVDDGSVDDLASSMASRQFQLHIHRQSNEGAAVARNVGAGISRGDYVAFLDADDMLRPSWMEVMTEAAESSSATIHGGMEVVHSATGRTEIVRPDALGPAFDNFDGLFVPGAYAVRRDLFSAVGGFAPGLLYGEHFELGLRIAEQLNAHPAASWTTDEIIVTKFHDRRPDRYASYDKSRLQGAEYVLEHHLEQLARDPGLLADYHAVAGVAAFRLGRSKLGRSHIRSASRAKLDSKGFVRALISMIPGLGSLYWSRHEQRDR